MKCPQGLWVQTLITAVFQPTYMLTYKYKYEC